MLDTSLAAVLAEELLEGVEGVALVEVPLAADSVNWFMAHADGHGWMSVRHANEHERSRSITRRSLGALATKLLAVEAFDLEMSPTMVLDGHVFGLYMNWEGAVRSHYVMNPVDSPATTLLERLIRTPEFILKIRSSLGLW